MRLVSTVWQAERCRVTAQPAAALCGETKQTLAAYLKALKQALDLPDLRYTAIFPD